MEEFEAVRDEDSGGKEVETLCPGDIDDSFVETVTVTKVT